MNEESILSNNHGHLVKDEPGENIAGGLCFPLKKGSA